MSGADGGFTGSMADVPEDLLTQIKYLEKIFTVDRVKLKEITNRFVSELDKGQVLHLLNCIWLYV